MRFRTAVAVVLLASAGLAHADDWNSTQRVLLGSALALSAIDWSQTRYVAKNGALYSERNRMLGAAPTVGRVNRYFLLQGAGVVGVSVLLPSKWRTLYLGGVTLYEAGFVLHNQAIGIRMSF